MPPDQFNQILEAIPRLNIRKWKDEDIQMLFKIQYWITLRFNEAVRLQTADFDFETKRVYLGITKANKEDYAPIPPPFLHELSTWLLDKSGPLFPGLTYGTAIKWIQRLGMMLDIPAWTSKQSETGENTKSHIFRKTMGKDLLYGTHGMKAPINVISKQLRHKGKNPAASTWQYLKVAVEDVNAWWQDNQELQDKDQLV